MANQSDYHVAATLNDIDVRVTHFSLAESLSGQFTITLQVVESRLFANPPLRDTTLIDRPAVITLLDDGVVKRTLHGIIEQVGEGAVGARHRNFTVIIRPQISRLELVANCRIFQLKTAQEIISEVLRANGITHFKFTVSDTRRRRDYCVQYNETDLDFIDRLAAEEGFIYWFEHEAGFHTLQFHDRIEKLPVLPEGRAINDNSATKTEASLWAFSYHENRVTTHSRQRDYNFEAPAYQQEHRYSGLYVDNQGGPYEHYSYNGRYKQDEQGEPFTRYQQEFRQREQRTAQIQGDHLDIGVGHAVELTGLDHEKHNGLWAIVSHQIDVNQPQVLEEEAVGSGQHSTRHITQCVPFGQPWRAAELTKPVVSGPQMAHVVGPPNEELFCDEYGRVKVQFPWDRQGKQNEYSSCWIRVAQHWAGNQYGHMAIPRIGHEVIVDFLEGDPDQPIITGRTYDAQNATPHELPINKTQMTIKSKSFYGSGFNELRFDDKRDAEEVFIHAEKDQNNVVKNDETTKIGHDRTENVTNDELIEIGHDHTHNVGNDVFYDVKRNQQESYGKDHIHNVGNIHKQEIVADHEETIGGQYKGQISGSMKLDVGSSITNNASQVHKLMAGQTFEITGPGGKIIIDSAGITLEAATINLKGAVSMGGSGSGQVEALNLTANEALPICEECEKLKENL